MPVRIIVCGGTDFNDRCAVFRVLDHIHTQRSITEIIQGNCPVGVDRWAREWALNCGQACTSPMMGNPKNVRYRNQNQAREMIAMKPDGVVMFPGQGESMSVVAAARQAGIPVYQPYGKRPFVGNSKTPIALVN